MIAARLREAASGRFFMPETRNPQHPPGSFAAFAAVKFPFSNGTLTLIIVWLQP
jgi:hypothetical protein